MTPSSKSATRWRSLVSSPIRSARVFDESSVVIFARLLARQTVVRQMPALPGRSLPVRAWRAPHKVRRHLVGSQVSLKRVPPNDGPDHPPSMIAETVLGVTPPPKFQGARPIVLINQHRAPQKGLRRGPVRPADLVHGAKCVLKNQPNLGEATTTRDRDATLSPRRYSTRPSPGPPKRAVCFGNASARRTGATVGLSNRASGTAGQAGSSPQRAKARWTNRWLPPMLGIRSTRPAAAAGRDSRLP